MRRLPVSLGFFLATAVVFVLQLIPIIGIALMLMFAMFWSVVLVNGGMVGTALEALIGRVSRWWLLLPVTFYGGYFALAAADNASLRELSTSYDAANARVSISFNPERQALVFENGGDGSWFVQNYRLPVAYSRNGNLPEEFLSNRMMSKEICDQVRDNRALNAAFIYAFAFQDGDAIGSRKFETRFCDLRMPERPVLPLTTVTRREDNIHHRSLPVTRVTTIINTYDGHRVQLLGGVAAPLNRIPMPVIGCGLNSGAAKWQCSAQFWRNRFTPIVAGDTRYNRDSLTLARALGLKRVDIAERTGGDAKLARLKMAEVENATFARQLAAIDRIIADPSVNVGNWQTGVVESRPDALAARADAIMIGLERAAAMSGSDPWRTRDSGRVLAQLIAGLPRDNFERYGRRLLTLYQTYFATYSIRDQRSHWLWEAEPLLRRLGDLGTSSLFVAVDPRASSANVNGAGIEAMCRIGQSGRARSGPVLLGMWRKLGQQDRDERRALFVALRRAGIAVPRLVESNEERASRERGNKAFGGVFQQRASPMDELLKNWGDVRPESPPRVCSPREWQARREEQFGGKRKTNLI